MFTWFKNFISPKKFVSPTPILNKKEIKSWCPFCGSYCGEHDPEQKPIQQVHCPGCGRDLFT